MSFSIQFAATSDYSARQKLAQASAPAAVKALIELALAGLRWPQQASESKSVDHSTGSGLASGGASRLPVLVAVCVETSGHIEEGSASQRSYLNSFAVQPLYE